MVDFLLSPLTLLMMALIGMAALRGRWRTCAQFAAAFALVLMTPLAANVLVRLIEARVPDELMCRGTQPAIVVLGGGFDHDPSDVDDVAALSATSFKRLLAGAALFLKQTDAHLYIVGAADSALPESDLLAGLAIRLGVPAAAISTERTSMTTWENAQNLHALSKAPQQIALVTSALHLPRALIAFRAAGFAPCGVASHSEYIKPRNLGALLPRSSSLRRSEAALHEWIGSLVYLWRARQAPTQRDAAPAQS